MFVSSVRMANGSSKETCLGQNRGNIATQSILRWEKSEEGWSKLNVDASVHEGAASFSVGMVLRNNARDYRVRRHCDCS